MDNNRQISERDRQFADEFSMFVNGRMCSAKDVGMAMAADHRYLVNEKGKVMFHFMETLAADWRKGVMTSATSGLAGWLLQQWTHWRHKDFITLYLRRRITKIGNDDRQTDYISAGGTVQGFSAVFTGRQRQGRRLCMCVFYR